MVFIQAHHRYRRAHVTSVAPRILTKTPGDYRAFVVSSGFKERGDMQACKQGTRKKKKKERQQDVCWCKSFPRCVSFEVFSVKARDPEGCSSTNRNDQREVLLCYLRGQSWDGTMFWNRSVFGMHGWQLGISSVPERESQICPLTCRHD